MTGGETLTPSALAERVTKSLAKSNRKLMEAMTPRGRRKDRGEAGEGAARGARRVTEAGAQGKASPRATGSPSRILQALTPRGLLSSKTKRAGSVEGAAADRAALAGVSARGGAAASMGTPRGGPAALAASTLRDSSSIRSLATTPRGLADAVSVAESPRGIVAGRPGPGGAIATPRGAQTPRSTRIASACRVFEPEREPAFCHWSGLALKEVGDERDREELAGSAPAARDEAVGRPSLPPLHLRPRREGASPSDAAGARLRVPPIQLGALAREPSAGADSVRALASARSDASAEDRGFFSAVGSPMSQGSGSWEAAGGGAASDPPCSEPAEDPGTPALVDAVAPTLAPLPPRARAPAGPSAPASVPGEPTTSDATPAASDRAVAPAARGRGLSRVLASPVARDALLLSLSAALGVAIGVALSAPPAGPGGRRKAGGKRRAAPRRAAAAQPTAALPVCPSA